MEEEISPLLSLTEEQPVSAEILNTEEMEMEMQLTEKVLLDKKILGHIFENLPKDELKKIRLVNSVWRSAASAQIRQRQEGSYLITTSENLQKFVDFWNGRNDNIPYKNFTISLQHNYPSNILQLYWETISEVVTNLQISYGEAEKSIKSLDEHSNLNYPSLKDLKLSMHNIWKEESLATCKNMLFGPLQSSPNLEKFSVFVFGDYRSITLSDFFVDAMKTRDNKNLADLHIKGLDIVDHHFTSLAEIADLGLTKLSLEIPKFENSQLSGEGLIKFLESQSDTLKMLKIIDVTGVFDTCEFPKLENLSSLDVQKWTITGRHNPLYVDEGIDYETKLPNLETVCFRSMGQYKYGIQKFLPLTHSCPITFVTHLELEPDEFITESEVMEALDSFRNLKWLHLPARYRPLMEVYKTQENLETLILGEDILSTKTLDKMLTGLEQREHLILRSIAGLLDKLTLDCDNVEETGLGSIGCLKKLRKLQVQEYLTNTTMQPSLLTFKLALTRMKFLEEINFGNGRKLLMRDLPEDRPLLNSDIMKNIKGGDNAGMSAAGSTGTYNADRLIGIPRYVPNLQYNSTLSPVPPNYSPSPPSLQTIPPLPSISRSDSNLSDILASQARRLQELLRSTLRPTTTDTPPPKRQAPE